ncbi:hypothetical protein RJ639_019889 [Escallonia herrerae]|uniref:DUF659 domain-containing protein n=1 Tax=Escallonia herrerae TaxID=1293975 RepID=A0AA88V7Y9_9ASTE|nr:hypothetical protein RJ639_019889 [Escallonia herrerae]
MSGLVARTGRHQQRYESGCRLIAGYGCSGRNAGGTSEKTVEVLMINSTSGPGLLFPKVVIVGIIDGNKKEVKLNLVVIRYQMKWCLKLTMRMTLRIYYVEAVSRLEFCVKVVCTIYKPVLLLAAKAVYRKAEVEETKIMGVLVLAQSEISIIMTLAVFIAGVGGSLLPSVRSCTRCRAETGKRRRLGELKVGRRSNKYQSLINVMAASKGKAVFLSANDCSSIEKSGANIAEILLKEIESIGPPKVVQVVTTNAAKCKLRASIIEKKYRWILCSGCLPQTLDVTDERYRQMLEFKAFICGQDL